MNYLILAAGVGRRMGPALAGTPKCLIHLGTETLIGRLLRQIRTGPGGGEARLHAVVGYRGDEVARTLGDCRVFRNPFFDQTSLLASLWFARECFDDELVVLHGDLVFSNALWDAIARWRGGPFLAYDSSIRDDREINVRAAEGRVTRFGVHFRGYSGAYAGVLGLGREEARGFIDWIDRRLTRGFNGSNVYYFAPIRELLAARPGRFAAFDLSGQGWQEVDRPGDLSSAQAVAD